MPRHDIGTLALHVSDTGRGTPLLLVHGFPLDHTMWRPQIDAFTPSHRVIAPDLRGFGASDVTEGTVTMAQHADDLAALLDALGVSEPVVYCGLSMGGYVGWEFLRRHRDRVRALIVCDSRAAGDSEEAQANRAKMAANVLDNGPEVAAAAMRPKLFADSTRRDHPEIVESLESTMLATAPHGIAASLHGMAARADATELLATIAVPTLLVVGESDAITPPDEMAAVAAAIPGATLERIPNAGHMAPLENAEAVNAVLRTFLAGL
jgi:3-oxoadipate enol-lactonase